MTRAVDVPSIHPRTAREFLPAALEIQETPPAPLGRAVLWTIVALCTSAMVWACLGEVDIVAIAGGKIVPSGQVKVVQPFELAVVLAIHVGEGQRVRRGDLLIELDATLARADRDRVATALVSSRLGLARLRALAAGRGDSRVENALEEAVDAVTREHSRLDASTGERALAGLLDRTLRRRIGLQAAMLLQERREFDAHQGRLQSELEQLEAEQAGARATVVQLERTLPLITRRAEAFASLAGRKMLADLTHLELEERRIARRQSLAVARHRIDETVAAGNVVRQQRREHAAAYRRSLGVRLAESEEAVRALALELAKASARVRRARLTAPVAGYVQQLAVHTPGGVVTPAQPLMRIVPERRQLTAEAWLANRDVGFVTEGMPAEVKVEAFPFTRYGTVRARVSHVSDDAIADEQLGLVYGVRVALSRSDLVIGPRRVGLVPGMAVAVEIKTGRRRLIEFVLSPLLRGLDESARER